MKNSTNEAAAEQELILSLDSMCVTAKGALSRIHGIARCALLALESEAGVRNPEAIAEALMAIALDAEMAHNDVAVEAEAHGICTLDLAWQKRLEARCRAEKTIAARGA